MGTDSKIEWTESTWNPVVGCSKVSDGCKNCYAERMAYRLACMYRACPQKYKHLKKYHTVTRSLSCRWNGEISCDYSVLEIPLHWRQPRMIFIPSMGDLFHKSVPFEFIAKVFYTVSICYWHTFQILTKRPERTLEFYDWIKKQKRGLWWEEFGVLARHLPMDNNEEISGPYDTYHINAKKHYYPDIPEPVTKLGDAGIFVPWPPPNLWLGVTAENQEQYNRRWPIAAQIPAAIHFVSGEPLLSGINISHGQDLLPDWFIVGGESGPGARYCCPQHIRDIVKQCNAAGVKCFVKQMHLQGKAKAIKDINQFPKDLQVREMPDSAGKAGE